MRLIRLVVVIAVMAVLVVGVHDAVKIAGANRDARNTAKAAASAAVASLTATHNAAAARQAAGGVATRGGDVVTGYHYDPTAATVRVTIGASTSSWVVGRIDKSLTDDISASATARPG